MQDGGDEEGDKGGRAPRALGDVHPVVVDMTQHPSVDGAVPLAPPNVERLSIPPILVELSVGVAHDLSEEVQQAVEHSIESNKETVVVRKLDESRQGVERVQEHPQGHGGQRQLDDEAEDLGNTVGMFSVALREIVSNEDTRLEFLIGAPVSMLASSCRSLWCGKCEQRSSS